MCVFVYVRARLCMAGAFLIENVLWSPVGVYSAYMGNKDKPAPSNLGICTVLRIVKM